MSIERWHAKADALWRGWKAVLGVEPTRHQLELVLAVAEHETSCGDSSVASHNWGACQKPRKLTDAEKAALAAAGLVPQFPHAPFIAEARHALAAAIEAGKVAPLVDEELYCDSYARVDPPTGKSVQVWYWVFFYAFADDDGGAALLVKVLVKDRASCAAVLARPDALPRELASSMYNSHYFDGVHPRTAPGGPEANIADYTKAIEEQLPGVRVGLADWSPPAPAELTEAQLRWYTKLDEARHGTGREGLDALDELEAAPDTEPQPAAEAAK